MAPAVSRGPQAPLASAALLPLAVSPLPREPKEPPAYPVSRPMAFRPKQKGKQKVQEYPQAFRPRLDEAAAFPQNRWS